MYELTPDFILKVLSDIEHSTNHDRKKREYISEQIYDGNLWFYVKDRLADWYPLTYHNYSISDYSVLKKIVDKKSKAYKEPPLRKLGSETETEAYHKIMKDSDFNSAMKRVDKLYNQHKYCSLAVFRDNELDDLGIISKYKYKAIPMAPYSYDVVKDEEGCPRVYVLTAPDEFVTDGPFKDLYNPIIAELGDQDEGTGYKAYIFWTEKEHKIIRVKRSLVKKKKIDSFEYMEMEGNPEGINPWGVLPFVEVPHELDKNYPNPSPLPGQTVEVNALNSVYLTSGNMQIGQLVLKYPAGQDIQTVNQGLMTAIKLPQSEKEGVPETDATYISPSPDLAGQRESIMTFMNMILDEQGISAGQVVTGSPDEYSSGFDRLLANADVQGIIEDNQEVYAKSENKAYEIIKKIEDSYGNKSFKSESLQIIFKKPKMLVSDTEKLGNIKQMIELGLIEDYEKFMIVDPNLTDEQAKEKAKKIAKSKRDLVKKLSINDNQE